MTIPPRYESSSIRVRIHPGWYKLIIGSGLVCLRIHKHRRAMKIVRQTGIIYPSASLKIILIRMGAINNPLFWCIWYRVSILILTTLTDKRTKISRLFYTQTRGNLGMVAYFHDNLVKVFRDVRQDDEETKKQNREKQETDGRYSNTSCVDS